MRLQGEAERLLNDHLDDGQVQFSLMSETGEDDWKSGIGRAGGKPYLYNKLNQSLKGTYIEEVINRYPGYYRWRLLLLEPGRCYSIHSDNANDKRLKYHYRIHIPIVTNDRCLVMFFKDFSKKGSSEYHHLMPGKSYLFNANTPHTALNGSTNLTRIHLVGQKSK